MSVRHVLLSSVIVLTACATAQENPNYQFSSKYNPEGNQNVQVASYTQPVTPPADQPVFIDYDAGPATSGPALSETEQAFDADTMQGTPGYDVFQAESSGTPAPAAPVELAPNRPQGARAVPYDYSPNVIIADTPTVIAPEETRQLTYGAGYTVVPGDTVYSLARRLCVPLTAVTEENAIGADYAIRIGQTLSLPASRC